MNHIVSHLSRLTDPSEILYSITMQDVFQQLSHRMGEEALIYSADDLQLAKAEVLAAIEHDLDCIGGINYG